jgi:hypothetical protein
MVRTPSAHAIIESPTDSISGNPHDLWEQIPHNVEGFYGPHKTGFRIGHVEELDNFEMKRSNAVRRKPMRSNPVAQRLDSGGERSYRPFTYLLPIEPTPCKT